MNVAIYSREAIEKLLKKGFPENTVIISFFDQVSIESEHMEQMVNGCGKAKCLFRIKLPDIYYDELEDYHMCYEDYFTEADELARFIIMAQKSGFDVICQCEYGQSRSAGCAAAILEFFNQKGILVFADYKYCPNQMVYHKVYDALENYKINHSQ